eukprot:UN03351
MNVTEATANVLSIVNSIADASRIPVDLIFVDSTIAYNGESQNSASARRNLAGKILDYFFSRRNLQEEEEGFEMDLAILADSDVQAIDYANILNSDYFHSSLLTKYD